MTEPQEVGISVPSAATIAKATLAALVVGALVVVTVVLPAEYGLDPLGTGRVLGLLELGQAEEATATTPPTVLNTAVQPGGHNVQRAGFQRETVTFTLGPREGMEYKYRLAPGDSFVYSWTASADVNYDMHSEPDDGPRGYAETFDKEDGRNRAHGAYTAPFPGVHGWYWENQSRDTVTVTLSTAGFYEASIEYRRDREPAVKWF
jgi:hypothetical protein